MWWINVKNIYTRSGDTRRHQIDLRRSEVERPWVRRRHLLNDRWRSRRPGPVPCAVRQPPHGSSVDLLLACSELQWRQRPSPSLSSRTGGQRNTGGQGNSLQVRGDTSGTLVLATRPSDDQGDRCGARTAMRRVRPSARIRVALSRSRERGSPNSAPLAGRCNCRPSAHGEQSCSSWAAASWCF